MTTNLFKAMLIFLVAVMLLTACGDDKEEKSAPETTGKPIIKLAEMPWLSAQANTAVAKILLEEQLGYPVELVPVVGPEQWDAVAAGTLHAQLEIWPLSSEKEVEKYIEQDQTIEYGGDLGPVGQGGWYVPFYVIRDHPDLMTWEGLQNPDNIALFATADTGSTGRLLSGDPNWVQSQYAETMIKNLGLDLQIVYAGSEEEELAVLKAAYDQEEPILIYFWTPHWAMAIYDLFQIKLPDYTEECYADLSAIDCAYPPEALGKALWPGLKDYAPDAYQFLKNMRYSTLDQIKIMAPVQIENKTVEESARAWIKDNEAIWKTWLSTNGD